MLHLCGDDPNTGLMCTHEGTCVHSATTGAYSCLCHAQWGGPDCSGMRCSEPEITCYNQVDYDAGICTREGCDCLNDGYGADCRGVRCGLEPGRCYNGALCIDAQQGICSACPAGVIGRDCSMSKSEVSRILCRLACRRLVTCPKVKGGYCHHGGICVNGSTCLCGHRSEWSGVSCLESKSPFVLRCQSAPCSFHRAMFRKSQVPEWRLVQ